MRCEFPLDGPEIPRLAWRIVLVGDLRITGPEGEPVSSGGHEREAISEGNRKPSLQPCSFDHPGRPGQIGSEPRTQIGQIFIGSVPAVVTFEPVLDLYEVDPADDRPRVDHIGDTCQRRLLAMQPRKDRLRVRADTHPWLAAAIFQQQRGRVDPAPRIATTQRSLLVITSGQHDLATAELDVHRVARMQTGRVSVSLTTDSGSVNAIIRSSQQLGCVVAEYLGTIAVARFMQRRDERANPRRHHEQILSRLAGSGVAVGMRDSFRGQNRASRTSFECGDPDAKTQDSSEDIPSLVIFVMDVQRRDPPVLRVPVIRPLDDHEVGRCSPDLAAVERSRQVVTGHRAIIRT